MQQLQQCNFENRCNDTPIVCKAYFITFTGILHKVLRAAVVVIDKTDYIVKDTNKLILFQLFKNILFIYF